MKSAKYILLLLVSSIFASCSDDTPDVVYEDKETVFVTDFDVSCRSIPVKEIHEGGPPKDGIPAIDEPKYITPSEATFLKDDDLVLGIEKGNRARAYPTRILDWHEIVNDSIGDENLLITYCPLCGSGMAFSSFWGGELRTFGVSGLLYNSDVLLYDRKTESLWSQIKAECVAGKELGTKLKQETIVVVPWKTWKSLHPNTDVLSTETGYNRNYDSEAYDLYRKTNSLWFPVSASSNEFPNKEWVLGLELNGKFKAYAFSELKKSNNTKVDDFFAGQSVTVEFDPDSETGVIKNQSGEIIPHTRLYWFAWYTFHPDTEVYRF